MFLTFFSKDLLFLLVKWTDNLQWIEHHQNFVTSFSSLTLHAVFFFVLKGNTFTHSFQSHYSKQTNHPYQSFPQGRSGYLTKGGNWGAGKGGVLLEAQSLNLPLLLDITPTKKLSPPVLLLITDHILGKKVLIAFRQILPIILPGACIFSYTVMACVKKLDGTKSLNTKQCPAGLSPRIIPQVSPLPKLSPPLMLLCCTYQIWTVLLPQNLYGKPWGRGKILPNSQKCTHLPNQKNPLQQIYIFRYQVSFLPH